MKRDKRVDDDLLIEGFISLADIKVSYDTFKEVVIMDYVRFSKVDDLVRFANVTAGGKTVGLYWVNGMVFVYYPLPAREVVARSIMEEKKVYWTFVGFAVMPQYQSRVETREKIISPVIDMSGSLLFQRVAEWLKQQK